MTKKLLLFLLSSAFYITANTHQELLSLLYNHNVIRYGSFTLKNGSHSPIYIDMRMTISSPDLLNKVAQSMHSLILDKKYDRICGVPYGALPLATTIALQRNEPMIMLRKEIKTYGTQKQIEGFFLPGDHVLLVEDVMTTGSSILESVRLLEEQGLIIEDIIVFLDREEGGIELLRDLGYSVYTVFTLIDVLAYAPQTENQQ